MLLKELIPIYKCFVDLDGVLCDFENGFKKFNELNLSFEFYYKTYKQKKEEFKNKKKQKLVGGKFLDLKNPWDILSDPMVGNKFWANLKWMSDGKDLWNYLKSKNIYIEICSAPDKTNYSVIGKKEWCKRELGSDIKVNLTNPKIGEKSINKVKFANSKFDILIDDKIENIIEWNKVGTGIHHVNSLLTIQKLEEILK